MEFQSQIWIAEIDVLLCRSDDMADNNYDSNMLSPISLNLRNNKFTL